MKNLVLIAFLMLFTLAHVQPVQAVDRRLLLRYGALKASGDVNVVRDADGNINVTRNVYDRENGTLAITGQPILVIPDEAPLLIVKTRLQLMLVNLNTLITDVQAVP